MSITLVVGPMFSGKSSEVLMKVRYASYANQPSLIVKYAGDVRYTDEDIVATHDGVHQGSTRETERSAQIDVISATSLGDIDVSQVTTIGVDEGQFYPDLAEVCERWAQEGKTVIVAALDGDFNRHPFPQVSQLAPLCESIEKKRGICMTCRQAPSSFTERTSGGTDIVQIGANDSYKAVCRRCYRSFSSS